MCGIVGFVGDRPAVPVLLDGLTRLEYRGYDSAGVAVVGESGPLQVVRCAGNLAHLQADPGLTAVDGTVGIGHTRWATHGRPDVRNSHPHTSEDAAVALVHNGIIENHRELRAELEAAQRSGFEHFMLKEIHEQPRALADTLRNRVDPVSGRVVLDEVRVDTTILAGVQRVVLLGCGTTHNAARAAAHALERWAGVIVETDIASEFRLRRPVLDSHTLVVGISQSGETLDTILACRQARRCGAPVLAICNVVDATLAREADAVLYTRAGFEIGVAATKTFTCQLAVCALLAVWLGQARGTLPDAEGYPAGELKHGPLALIEPGVPVVCVATSPALAAKTLSNAAEVVARGARLVLVATDSVSDAAADAVLRVPATHELLSPIVDSVVLQLLAYYVAVARGCNVDQPRNLAKTVTVGERCDAC